MNTPKSILQELYEVIEQRRGGNPETSYVAKMFNKGRSKIAEKFGEEAVEVIVAALAENREQVIYESADALFHLLILWAEQGVKPEDVVNELHRRMGQSGLDEKAARKVQS